MSTKKKENITLEARIIRALVSCPDVSYWIGELKGSPPWSDEMRGQVLNFTKKYHPERNSTADEIMDEVESMMKRKRIFNKSIKTRNSQWHLPVGLHAERMRTLKLRQYINSHPVLYTNAINEFYEDITKRRIEGASPSDAMRAAADTIIEKVIANPRSYLPHTQSWGQETLEDTYGEEKIELGEVDKEEFYESLEKMATAEGVLSAAVISI